jgi:hypothetical protein
MIAYFSDTYALFHIVYEYFAKEVFEFFTNGLWRFNLIIAQAALEAKGWQTQVSN